MQGTMDAQDVLNWGKVQPDCLSDEKDRIEVQDLCKWGKKYNLDGFMSLNTDARIYYLLTA
ncbi:hypothetical protein D9611_001417 [Ephemerocybe angulata]|uniref:Uncharacterized protein n=1 Tax=Ephemerocybe angulata TaxID=980116 RepID=A0A8H5CJI0_9AGAR|nr:hypothetical protein D9611_001417 [Tulosesus angulatus]